MRHVSVIRSPRDYPASLRDSRGAFQPRIRESDREQRRRGFAALRGYNGPRFRGTEATGSRRYRGRCRSRGARADLRGVPDADSGVLSEYPNPWLIVGYVLVFLALLLFLIWFLSGRSYLDIFESARTINLLVRRWNAVHAVKVVSVLIYLANGLLIAFVLIVFAISGEKKPPCPSELLDRMGSNSGPQVSQIHSRSTRQRAASR